MPKEMWDCNQNDQWQGQQLHLDLFLFIGTTFIRPWCTNLQSLKRMFNPVNIQEDPLAIASLTIA